MAQLNFQGFQLRQNSPAEALFQLRPGRIADCQILQFAFQRCSLVGDIGIVPIGLTDALQVPLSVADDLARIHWGRSGAIVDAFRIVTAVAVISSGVATVEATTTLLVTTTALLAALSLLLATLLPALTAFTLLTALALLATLLPLLTLLLTALLLTALSLLLALALLLPLLLALLTTLALLLTVLALLPLLTLRKLLLQAFDLGARALDGRHLAFHLVLLSGGSLLAVA